MSPRSVSCRNPLDALDRLAALDPPNSPRMVVLVTRTAPDLLKKNRRTHEPCPYARVERLAERYGMLGARYQNAVNNQRLREGAPEDDQARVQYFQAEALWGGKGRATDHPYLVQHADTKALYVAFMPRNQDDLPAVGQDRWTDLSTGLPIDPEDLIDYLPLQKPPTRQRTEKAIFWRTIGVENIVQIRCGWTFTVTRHLK